MSLKPSLLFIRKTNEFIRNHKCWFFEISRNFKRNQKMRKEKLIIRGKHLPLTVGLTNKETLKKKYSKNMKICLT